MFVRFRDSFRSAFPPESRVQASTLPPGGERLEHGRNVEYRACAMNLHARPASAGISDPAEGRTASPRSTQMILLLAARLFARCLIGFAPHTTIIAGAKYIGHGIVYEVPITPKYRVCIVFEGPITPKLAPWVHCRHQRDRKRATRQRESVQGSCKVKLRGEGRAVS